MADASNFYTRPPKPLVVEHDKDMASEWNLWKQQYQFFEIAAQMATKGQPIQIATFMNAIGKQAVQLYNTLPPPVTADGNEPTLDQVKGIFESYFTPKANITFERYKFHKIYQNENETVDQLMSRLRLQAQKCDFQHLTDGLIRDQLILGVNNDKLRTKLLSDDITLVKAVQVCQATESSYKQAQEITKEHERSINAVQKIFNKKRTFDCRNCGKNHEFRNCSAYRHTCKKCNAKNHFESMCTNPSTTKGKNNRSQKPINTVEESTDSDEAYVGSMVIKKTENDLWSEKILISGQEYNIKLDTGAQCNVIPKSIADSVNATLNPCKIKSLVSFSEHRMKVLGEAIISCNISEQKCKVAFKVVAEKIKPILGANACSVLGLVKRVKAVKIDEEIFKGLGCFKDFVYDIDLVPNPEFEICPARRIPYKIMDEVKAELDKMVELDVIEPVSEPTPSVSPMVVVRKNNKIRICIDPTNVNANILRRHFPMQTIEAIAAKLKASKYFTLLDCNRGFWQIRVSDRTKKILTFSTPWGRYSSKRLPFGISSAPEVFQAAMHSLFAKIPKVEVSIDDILIHSNSLNELRKKTEMVIEILKAHGLKLNKGKCKFEQTKIKFLGHIISQKGMAADPEKTDAINRLKAPTNRKELQRALGKFTYLNKYIKNFSAITSPLRALLQKSTQWVWGEIEQNAFDNLKDIITKPPVLKLYDVNEDVKLEVDASSTALGAVLLQNKRPVGYASKALTECQKRYSQLEKEALAIKFGCEKFHEYVWGKKLIVESDHKPLESIFRKPLHSSPARLQRIRLSLLTYNPVVVYKPGIKMYLADPLSRDCENSQATEEDDHELQVQLILSISDSELARLTKLTETDETCKLLKQYILNGWPSDIKNASKAIKEYWHFRDELSIYDEIIYKSHMALIPTEMRPEMLKYIHSGHFGYEGCLQRAKDYVFWPKMRCDIYEFIQKCPSCQVNQRSNFKECLANKEIPLYPFEICGTDLFHFKGDDYVVITDSYSGFIKFKKLAETTSSNVIKFLKDIFSSNGTPRVLESDNGPQYSSTEFKNFSKEWKFNHITSSPYHPRGNGLAERAVQTSKNILKKCEYDNSDYQLGILNYMNTPRGKLGSPAQRLYSRNLRSQIPATTSSLQLNQKPIENIPSILKQMRTKQKEYADKGSTQLKQLQIGDKVVTRINSKNKWEPATIENQFHPRSYIVKDHNGHRYRRNSWNIKPTNAAISHPPNEIPEVEDENSTNSQPLPNIFSELQQVPNVLPEIQNEQLLKSPSSLPAVRQSQPIIEAPPNVTTTRSGRQVKPPARLDL